MLCYEETWNSCTSIIVKTGKFIGQKAEPKICKFLIKQDESLLKPENSVKWLEFSGY